LLPKAASFDLLKRMSINPQELKTEALLYKNILLQFLKNPVHFMKSLPHWDWKRVLIFTLFVTLPAGLLAGVIEGHLFFIMTLPLFTLILTGVSTLFFYYAFQIFARKTVSIRRLYLLIVFANIPFFIFQIAASLVPFILMIGFAMTALLLVVGFVEVFELPRKPIAQAMVGLYVIFFIIWLMGLVQSERLKKAFEQKEVIRAPEVHLGD
jgi:hypothetical protein